MEKVMTNGFCELNEKEMMEIEGGFTWPWTAAREAAEAKRRADAAAREFVTNPDNINTNVWDAVAPGLISSTPGLSGYKGVNTAY